MGDGAGRGRATPRAPDFRSSLVNSLASVESSLLCCACADWPSTPASATSSQSRRRAESVLGDPPKRISFNTASSRRRCCHSAALRTSPAALGVGVGGACNTAMSAASSRDCSIESSADIAPVCFNELRALGDMPPDCRKSAETTASSRFSLLGVDTAGAERRIKPVMIASSLCWTAGSGVLACLFCCMILESTAASWLPCAASCGRASPPSAPPRMSLASTASSSTVERVVPAAMAACHEFEPT
mmetsp:Transcript_1993/g.4748  ORF Transcript_1993/g.4748 Transcript_1993/m.4748 type:complete len:245 (+) Transcript_1993:970-1704(+)